MRKRNRPTPPDSTSSQNGVGNGQTPADILDTTDPGDDTQERFRYQHAYGVILLAGAAREVLPYTAIWCEHHEDLLGERTDGLWDGYQVKTQRPENGEWHLQKDALKHSIKRFVVLETRFPGHMHEFTFVTNCAFLDSDAEDKIGRSPVRLLQAIRSVTTADDLGSPFDLAFETLRHYCDCSAASLLIVLKKVRLVCGPALTNFDAELTQDHLPHLPACASLSVPALKALRDELVSLVYRASAKANDDPARHWCCILGSDHLNPALQAKKIPVAQFVDLIRQRHGVPFRYLPGSGYLELGHASEATTRLFKKMERGGIDGHFETMRRRALSAEYHLLELVQLMPDRFQLALNQIVSVVQDACDDAQLNTEAQEAPYGRLMLIDVQQRLKDIAEHRSEMVERQTYECLVGIAGLLSGECKVWWSKPFDLEEAA
jgi:hypothetical protein